LPAPLAQREGTFALMTSGHHANTLALEHCTFTTVKVQCAKAKELRFKKLAALLVQDKRVKH
jgi:hypothetical protein